MDCGCLPSRGGGTHQGQRLSVPARRFFTAPEPSCLAPLARPAPPGSVSKGGLGFQAYLPSLLQQLDLVYKALNVTSPGGELYKHPTCTQTLCISLPGLGFLKSLLTFAWKQVFFFLLLIPPKAIAQAALNSSLLWGRGRAVSEQHTAVFDKSLQHRGETDCPPRLGQQGKHCGGVLIRKPLCVHRGSNGASRVQWPYLHLGQPHHKLKSRMPKPKATL